MKPCRTCEACKDVNGTKPWPLFTCALRLFARVTSRELPKSCGRRIPKSGVIRKNRVVISGRKILPKNIIDQIEAAIPPERRPIEIKMRFGGKPGRPWPKKKTSQK